MLNIYTFIVSKIIVKLWIFNKSPSPTLYCVYNKKQQIAHNFTAAS